MVVGLAFVAVVVSSLFAQSMLVRYTAGHQPQHRAWAIALGMFALASVALAIGDGRPAGTTAPSASSTCSGRW